MFSKRKLFHLCSESISESTTVCQLPYEVIRAIFELAASDPDSPHITLKLLLVSHDTRNWLERKLYTKVQLLDEEHRDAFERCMIARDDDAFLANAIQQLQIFIKPNSELPLVYTNITHLSLRELDVDNFETFDLPSLQHLHNLKYLVLDLMAGDTSADTFPPNITHLQFRNVFWSNVLFLVQFVENCPLLTHIMLDCASFDSDVDEFVDNLLNIMDKLQECQRIVFIVPHIHPHDRSNVSETQLAEIRRFQEQYYPQLILVGIGGLDDPVQNIMQCSQDLLSQFEFWDEMEEVLAKTRGEKTTRSAPVPSSHCP